jgi:hypothetical protein
MLQLSEMQTCGVNSQLALGHTSLTNSFLLTKVLLIVVLHTMGERGQYVAEKQPGRHFSVMDDGKYCQSLLQLLLIYSYSDSQFCPPYQWMVS